MIDKKEIPLDDGTTILSQQSMTIGHLDAVLQTWILDGVRAASCIFRSDDVANLSYEQLKLFVKDAGLLDLDSPLTIQRTDDFTFVNFNFDY